MADSIDKSSNAKTWLPVIALIMLVTAANFITGTRNPRLWQDEVCYNDPAINLATGHGFTSGSWPMQGRHELFVGNTPLFPLVMAAWLKITGISLLGLRSLNFILIIAATACILLACRRTDLIRRWPTALFLAMLLLCGYSNTFDYRSARYDILGMFIFALLFLEFTIPQPHLRRILMLLTAALIPITGLQLIPLAFIVAVVLLLFLRSRVLIELIAVGIGIAVGGAIFLGLLKALNLLHSFTQSTVQFSGGSRSMASKLGEILHAMRSDFTPTILIAGLVIAAMVPSFRKSRKSRLLGAAAVLFALAISVGMALAGHFPVYYSWSLYVPMAICVAACVESLVSQGGSRSAVLPLVAAGLLACYGLPGYMIKSIREWRQNDPARVDQFVQSVASPSDVIFCDYAPYLAARRITPDVMTLPYLHAISESEKDSVSLIIANPDPRNLDSMTSTLGGTWKPVAEFWPTGVHDNSSYPWGQAWYHLVAYRRAN